MSEEKSEKHKKKDIKVLEKKVGELEELISQLQQEKEEVFSKLQRVSADFANYQKRVPKQISDSVAYEKESFVRALLGAIDNFEHALAGAEKAENLESFVKGIEIVHNEIINTLKGLSVIRIDSVGQKFDPNMHQALMQRTEPEKENGIVLEEFQKGYMINDKVVRPAKVVVNNIPTQQEQPEETEQEQSQEEQNQEQNQEQSKEQ
jgi:molecular chaperone GrpE